MLYLTKIGLKCLVPVHKTGQQDLVVEKFHPIVIVDEICDKNLAENMHKTDWWFSKRAM